MVSAAEYQMHPYDWYGGADELQPGSFLNITFLDVGQADAAVIQCDGEAMMIDGGDIFSSDLIYSFLRDHNISHLKYIICSHPQGDHAGGLAGALHFATVEQAYCSGLTSEGEGFNNFVYYLNQQGVRLEVPEPGMEFSLGSAVGKIIGPVNPGITENDTSLVVKLKYGNTSYLFTGDAEELEELSLVNAGEDLSCSVLKVAHHGSDTSSSAAFLRAAAPVYGVISCGAYNSYGHPSEGALARLAAGGVRLFRTDLQGAVSLYSDGTDISFAVEKNAEADTYASYYSLYVEPGTAADRAVGQMEPGTDYIVNTSSGKFHLPTCLSVGKMKEKNKWYYHGTRDELLGMGYSPCGNCHP